MSYKVLYQAGEDEIEEKKSRFIAHTLPVNSEDEAVAFLNKIKKEYWDARHNCYAYTIGRNNECTRCSDDGEPSGTAGLIKYFITHNDSFSQGFFEQVSCVFYTSFINEPGSEYRQYIALMVR